MGALTARRRGLEERGKSSQATTAAAV